MYTRHKISLLLLFLLVTVEAWCLELEVNEELNSNIISLLGIVFGFTIAAVTAMSGTNFLRFQSKVVDTNTKGVQMTNAQRLKEYFEFSCTIGLFSILLMVIFGIVPEGWLRLNIVCPLTYGLLFLNLCSSYFVLKLVLKYFAESVD